MRLLQRALVTVAGSAAIAAGALGCKPVATQYPQPRLVILYASCTVNRLYAAPYNTDVVYTPHLETFAKGATVFDKHHTESGQSGIAFASLFTGSQARIHGIFKHPRKLLPKLVVVPEVFAAAGYDTHSWLFHKMASSRLEYAQGVPVTQQYQDGPLEASSEPFVKILERLTNEPDYRAFVVTNFTVTHGPYQGELLDEFCNRYPGECTKRGNDEELEKFKQLNKDHLRLLSVDYDVAVEELELSATDERRLREINEMLYKADMYRLDKMFGAVVAAVEAAGLFEDSVIAFTSDHGEVLWRDNALLRWTHGYQLAPEVINVALMMSGPNVGIPAWRYTGVSRSIDVMPTLTSLAGIALPEDYEGRGANLAAPIRRHSKPPDLTAFSHSALLFAPMRGRRMEHLSALFPSPNPEYMWVSARRGDLYFKLRRRTDDSWYHSVYDLARDPEERNDLFDAKDPAQREILELLDQYKEEMTNAGYTAQARGVPRAKAIEMLRSMGYID